MISECLYHTSALAQQMTAVSFPFHAANPRYIDPGTGSLIIQVIIGFLVGGLVGAKVFWNRIKGFFRRLFSTRSPRERTKD